MKKKTAKAKTSEENIGAQLEKTKAQIEEIAALAKGKVESDAIEALELKRIDLDNKLQELKTSANTKGAQIKTEVGADLTKLNDLLGQIATSLKSQAESK
jgi:F0F1-type ATP synthase membrane subunit b/b'